MEPDSIKQTVSDVPLTLEDDLLLNLVISHHMELDELCRYVEGTREEHGSPATKKVAQQKACVFRQQILHDLDSMPQIRQESPVLKEIPRWTYTKKGYPFQMKPDEYKNLLLLAKGQVKTDSNFLERMRKWLLSVVTLQNYFRDQDQPGLYFCDLCEMNTQKILLGLMILEEGVRQFPHTTGTEHIDFMVLYGEVNAKIGGSYGQVMGRGFRLAVPEFTDYSFHNEGDTFAILFYSVTES